MGDGGAEQADDDDGREVKNQFMQWLGSTSDLHPQRRYRRGCGADEKARASLRVGKSVTQEIQRHAIGRKREEQCLHETMHSLPVHRR